LQLLNNQMQNETLAYVALVDRNGEALISDQLSLVGQSFSVPGDTRLEDSTWLDERVWVISTPIRKGRDGEQLGALRLALRLNSLEDFLNESRILVGLAGLIAILAGVLLAQGISGALAAPVQRLAAGARQVAQGDLSVQFEAGDPDELALLANAYNQMVAGLREREWLRDMFGRFVSEEVANAIRSGQVRLEGEHRVVSVLFCDMRGFTARAERQSPEEVLALLNEYLPIVVNAAQQHDGVVNKFGGDSTLVIYGAPRQLQESAYQAVLTALQVRASLEALNEHLAQRSEEPVRIGIGINTGDVVAGAVGPRERQEYTVIGDTVNLASRIEALNKTYPEYDILISQFTYQALASRQAEFDLVSLGEAAIRGKENPVQVWAVRGGKRIRPMSG
jgi:adenylate cyclase